MGTPIGLVNSYVRRRRPIRLLLAGLLVAGLVAGCGAAFYPPSPIPSPSPPATDLVITISGFAYQGTLTVPPGATVTVRNEDLFPHTLTAVDDSFTTPVIEGLGEATFQAPTVPGSYPITCQIHPTMSGTLIVDEDGVPPPPPPPGDDPPSPTPTTSVVGHHGD